MNSTELAVIEQPRQLLTIEPKKYVELVFESFEKDLAAAQALVADVVVDVTTTAGMAVAVKHRATFRDIRIGSEKARKERKAPILEIGKLLDSRQKELETKIAPFESKFDDAIKAEEARKESEKQARIAAEIKRVADLKERIAELRGNRTLSPISGSTLIAQHIGDVEGIAVDESFEEFQEAATEAKDAGLAWLHEIHIAAVAHEAEVARAIAEREELARLRAEQEERNQVERERIAQEARVAREKADAERKRLADEEAKAKAARDAAKAAEDARVAAERKAEADRVAVQRAQEDAERTAREAEEQKRREAIAAEEQRLADERAELERQREALRIAQQPMVPASEPDRLAPLGLMTPPAPIAAAPAQTSPPDLEEMLEVLAEHYNTSTKVVAHWLAQYDWTQQAA